MPGKPVSHRITFFCLRARQKNFIAAARKIVAASYPDLQRNRITARSSMPGMLPVCKAILMMRRHKGRISFHCAAGRGKAQPEWPAAAGPDADSADHRKHEDNAGGNFRRCSRILTYRNMQEALDYINAQTGRWRSTFSTATRRALIRYSTRPSP